MKMVALDPEAVEFFYNTIRKQLKMDYENCLGCGFCL